MMATMPQIDSYSAGQYGSTVRIYRRIADGPFHYEIPATGERKVIRPKFVSEGEAHAWCHRAVEDLEKGIERVSGGQLAIGPIFDLYLANRTPKKRTKGEQDADRRRAAMWKRRLGANRLPHEIRRYDWESFIEERGNGVVCAHNRREAHGEGRERCQGPASTSPRTVQADLLWLRSVFNWATDWGLPSGGYLLSENPVRGLGTGITSVAELLNASPEPHRPVASTDRYKVIMKHLEEAHQAYAEWKVAEKGKRHPWPPTTYGYLHELLPIVVGTGRRISAVLRLRWSDVLKDEGPHGSIRWRWTEDKKRVERVIPMSATVRAVFDRIRSERPGIHDTWIFPGLRSKGKNRKPTHRSVADDWLRRAEAAAGFQPLERSLWHAYRRGWATARKHLPDADVAFAGGWKDARTLRAVYQQPDQVNILRVVLDETELREKKG